MPKTEEKVIPGHSFLGKYGKLILYDNGTSNMLNESVVQKCRLPLRQSTRKEGDEQWVT